MKDKILELLQGKGKQFGLPKEYLDTYAGVLALRVSEDISEDELGSLIDNSLSLLEATQKFSDKRVSDAVRKFEQRNTGGVGSDSDEEESKIDLEGLSSKLEANLLKKFSEQLKSLESAQKEYEELKKRLDENDTAARQQSFDDVVSRIGKDLGLSGDLLGFAKAKLSLDMDEATIDKSLSDSKKLFIKSGLMDSGGKLSERESYLRKEAEEWVKSQQEVSE